MPQMNEMSWLNTSLKMVLLMVIYYMSMSTHVNLSVNKLMTKSNKFFSTWF